MFSNEVPTCNILPNANAELTNKQYVDTMISNIPTSSTGYTWTGPQVMSGGIQALNGNNFIASPLCSPAISDVFEGYYKTITSTSYTINPSTHVLGATFVYTGNDTGAVWFLPVPSATYVGCNYTFRNMSPSDQNLQLQIVDGSTGILNSLSYTADHVSYKKITLSYAQFEFRMVCELFPYNGNYYWNVVYITPSAWYETKHGGQNIYNFDNN